MHLKRRHILWYDSGSTVCVYITSKEMEDKNGFEALCGNVVVLILIVIVVYVVVVVIVVVAQVMKLSAVTFVGDKR